MKRQQILNIDSIKEKQRININGYIRSIPFITLNGKHRQAIFIAPQEITLCDSTDDNDICIVLMTASIETPIWCQQIICMFNLKTHVHVRYLKRLFSDDFNKMIINFIEF